MQEKMDELKRIYREVNDVNHAVSLLYWDQSTYMPAGGAEARGRSMAVMSRISQEYATNPRIGQLLDALQSYGESLPFDDDDAATLRSIRRIYERQVRIPPSFAAEFAEHQALSYSTWVAARPANDWKKVQPVLEKTLDLSRRLADFFPGYQHIGDPLIDFADFGMKAADVRKVFAELREGLVPIIQAIGSQEPVDDACLRQFFPKQQQLKFSESIARDFGYDFNRGRMDLTHHPFELTLGLGDVRITTRVDENDLGNCLFSVLHESGHAMYEQGLNPAYDGTALQGGTSAGVHESQSRTWENLVGRSRGFWEHYYPLLQAEFPEQLKNVSMDTFYRAVNKVEQSLIRTEADEVTYNLHPLIRFELEMEMLEGTLAVKDLPEAWNARYHQYLNINPSDDRDGVLQDVHWFSGPVGGAFQGYTIGNILSAMFYEKAVAQHPEIPAEVRQGQFATLHNWLRENIYQYGSKYTAPELIQRVTGGGLDVQPLLRYLRQKFSEIYTL